MSDNDTRDTVRQVMSAVLQTDLRADQIVDRASTPSWDSLKHIELLFSLEDACDVKFDREEIVQLDSLDAIVTAVEQRRV
jgi:acyl carrier protein